MRIFITGGSGLLGRWLVKLFEAAKHIVLAPSHEQFDITFAPWSSYYWKEIITSDVVVNCAAYVNIANCEKDTATAYLTNGYSCSWTACIDSGGTST